jgi:hypothetical protein
MIPNSSVFVEQTDVTGSCSTEYIPNGENLEGFTTFQKIKDMKSCKFNQKLFQGPNVIKTSLLGYKLCHGKLERLSLANIGS